MKIIRNIRASEKQDGISEYGNEAHVLLNEREIDVDGTIQYEYDKVVVANFQEYHNVYEIAEFYFKENNKQELLDEILVTTISGKTFYADPISRTDLSDAISIAAETNQTSKEWKLKTGWEIVTLEEMKEARELGLMRKGEIIAS